MKNSTLKKIVAVALTSLALTSCMGVMGGSKKKVYFMFAGRSNEMNRIFNNMVKEFNDTKGNELGIQVKTSPKTWSGFETFVSAEAASSNGVDVIMMFDDFYKKYAKYFDDVSYLIDDDYRNDLVDGIKTRYYYNSENDTSSLNDPLYGVPFYNDVTAFYYNKTALEQAGVTVISVDPDKLDAFNNGGKDNFGKTKADYGITINVPNKGFYRSKNPFVKIVGVNNGANWKKPSSDEKMIFNERISTSWDEIEDLGMILTKTHNESSPTDYGFYTEWWFSYSWSVGGDCQEDLSGDGYWAYTLPCKTSNFVVNQGQTYTGAFTGQQYHAGETLLLRDILNIAPTDQVVRNADGSFSVNDEVVDVRPSVLESETNGVLTSLPSTRESFERFAYLAGRGGLNVCPFPSVFNGVEAADYFMNRKLAFLIERTENTVKIAKNADFEWSVAEFPIFKEYEDPYDPLCDVTTKQGVRASHSFGSTLSVRSNSKVKDLGIEFIKWVMKDGQHFLAQNQIIPCLKSEMETFRNNYQYPNVQSIIDGATYQKRGDWIYHRDSGWINVWADPLNSKVRYGTMDIDEWFSNTTAETNSKLDLY